MKTHTIKGSFIAKFFPTKEGKEGTLDYPENFQEGRAAVKEGYVLAKCDGEVVKIPITEESLFQDSYRGCSLRGQGGGANLSEEEKAERKLDRKAEKEALAEMKMDSEMKAKLDAAIARKKEALKAASAK